MGSCVATFGLYVPRRRGCPRGRPRAVVWLYLNHRCHDAVVFREGGHGQCFFCPIIVATMPWLPARAATGSWELYSDYRCHEAEVACEGSHGQMCIYVPIIGATTPWLPTGPELEITYVHCEPYQLLGLRQLPGSDWALIGDREQCAWWGNHEHKRLVQPHHFWGLHAGPSCF